MLDAVVMVRAGFGLGPGVAPICPLVATSACDDNLDADGDGFPGYPTDPGCTSLADNDESDNCPSGPGCSECANLIDDDGDTFTDYPLDPGCTAASDSSELIP